MISSPCKSCPKLDMPKDLCLQDCDKIKRIQHMQTEMGTPPYPNNDRSDSISTELSLLNVHGPN
jgi:hypothetical protein